MNTEQELRPCPFCGGEAVLDEFENDHIIGWFGRCLECSASMPYAISKPIAVKQWNRRDEAAVTDHQAAYACLWRLSTDRETLHAARRELLGILGGQGSQAQRDALQWALDTLGWPRSIEPVSADLERLGEWQAAGGPEAGSPRRSSDEQAEVVEVPDIKFVIADYLELRDEALGFVSTDDERSKSAIELHDAIQTIHAKLSPPAVAAGGVTEALRNTTQWLEAALNCKNWHWDWDQRVVASADLDAAKAALAAVGDEGIRPDLLAEMTKHPGWSIERGYRDRGDDEGGPYGWCVYDVRGGRSDLEWDLIGFGETPHEALSAAVAALPTPPSRGEGV